MSTLKVIQIQHPSAASAALTLDASGNLSTSGNLTFPAGSASSPSIQATGDPNTGLFFPAADTIAFAEGGTEVLRIDSSGRLGLGTSSPAVLIHGSVSSGAATARLESTANSGEAGLQLYGKNSGGTVRVGQFKYDSTDYFRIGTTGAVAFAFETSDTERMRIDSSGRVGIGSNAPSSVLDIQAAQGVAKLTSTTGTNSVYFLASNTGGNAYFGRDNSAGTAFKTAYAVGVWNEANNPLVFGTNDLQRAQIDASGRLLVGTSTAFSQYSAGFQLVNNSGSGIDCGRFDNSASSSDVILTKGRGGSVGTRGIVSNNDQLGQIGFKGDDGSTLNSYAAAITAFVDGTPGTNDMPGRLVFSTTADGASSPTERMRIASGGGIFAYNLTGSASAGSTLKLISNEIIRDTSSIQFKKDVEDIEEGYAANLLDNARPVWFRAKDDKQNPEHSYWGFIAEELAEVEPRLCVFEDGAPFSVDYGKFSPLLLKLIQMQNEKIKSLETRLAALEAA